MTFNGQCAHTGPIRMQTVGACPPDRSSWAQHLNDENHWDCFGAEAEVQISNMVAMDQPPILPMRFGGLCSREPDSQGRRQLVIFTSMPRQPWYQSALKLGVGVVIGATVVSVVVPQAVGAALGIAATGPVAGGVMAGKMGSGLAAGSLWSGAQSVVMSGVGGTAKVVGGAVGGLLSGVGLGAGKVDQYYRVSDFTFPTDLYTCGSSHAVYICIHLPSDAEVKVVNAAQNGHKSKL
eukprot:TRINITY_DN28823_c0_g1_i1.p1 TRINITY_DN28823_c0_g1~~TRINITY_DN28823_c0_g1_i1.p1  ORF type:complete len:273 (+),score=10.65 TRINITY_DN28823_c0_g1_i1:114-821(+)